MVLIGLGVLIAGVMAYQLWIKDPPVISGAEGEAADMAQLSVHHGTPPEDRPILADMARMGRSVWQNQKSVWWGQLGLFILGLVMVGVGIWKEAVR